MKSSAGFRGPITYKYIGTVAAVSTFNIHGTNMDNIWHMNKQHTLYINQYKYNKVRVSTEH